MFLVSLGVAFVYCYHHVGSFPSQYFVSPYFDIFLNESWVMWSFTQKKCILIYERSSARPNLIEIESTRR
jgi:hypothetical protein